MKYGRSESDVYPSKFCDSTFVKKKEFWHESWKAKKDDI